MLLSKATYNKYICHKRETTIFDKGKKKKIETIFKPWSEHSSRYLLRIPLIRGAMISVLRLRTQDMLEGLS